MTKTPTHRVIVHRAGKTKFWTWTQVSRNGTASAVAPKVYGLESNATRAARRQVSALVWGFNCSEAAGSAEILGPRVDGTVQPAVVLIVDRKYQRRIA